MTTLGAHAAMSERAYLDSLILHGMKLGLHNIHALMDASGSPHAHYPIVHVGGTNGKGSVAAFLDAMLRAAGYRVGRFTSPHLLDVTERFLINGVPMNEEALAEHLAHFRRIAENADVYDFALSVDEMRAIDMLDRDERLGPHPDRFPDDRPMRGA